MWIACPLLLLCLVLTGCTAVCAVPLDALISPTTQVALSREGKQVGTISCGLFETGWRGAGLGGPVSGEEPSAELQLGKIKAPSGAEVRCELRPEIGDGSLTLNYRLVPQADMALNSFHVTLELPEAVAAGGGFVADGEDGEFPAELGAVHLRSAPTTDLALTLADGSALRLQFSEPTPVLLQDNRQWGPSFSVRVGPQMADGTAWPAQKALEVSLTLTATDGVRTEIDGPVTIAAGEDWVPLSVELDIEPGSAVDFSGFGQLDAPAGKHGNLIAREDGHLAFSRRPEQPLRFYGVNFCFTAHYITHEQAERLAERLVRLGYNTVRFHHFDNPLVLREGGVSTALNPETLDQLDYLFSALKKRGIYITIDLFISRQVFASEVFPGEEGNLAMDEFKMLVPVNDAAFANWQAFSRNLLTHENPYTGMRWADDPALGWISMINEGNPGNFIGRVSDRARGEWTRAWNSWLGERYGDAAALAEAWGVEPGGDPQAGTVPLQAAGAGSPARAHDLTLFLAETERAMMQRMHTFLREEVGTKALLTNMNGWSNPIQTQLARQVYDYVDDHFYVDHPQFLEQPWRLPSRCPNTSPVAAGAPGGRHCAFTRLLDKPFTISEYNYSGPGRFRGVGGIITGCMAALQDWSVVWRFAYSHGRDNLFEPRGAGYFDLVTDPLNQVAERAGLCLFLRGDMKPAPHSIGIAAPAAQLEEDVALTAGVAPPWNALALVTKVGTYVGEKAPADIVLSTSPDGAGTLDAHPYSPEAGPALVAEMRSRGWLSADNPTDLGARVLQSETGQLTVDAPEDVLTLDTPATAGGYAPAGKSIKAAAASIDILDTDATVWVSSLDEAPIAGAGRLLIAHLTDLQNTGAKFGERARQTLLAWGETPHLVRAGRATVRIGREARGDARVYAITTGGRRLGEVQASWDGDVLVIPLDVRGEEGARVMYEVSFEQ